MGTLEFVGSIQGESEIGYHVDMPYQCGLFAITGAENDNILIYISPNSEWYTLYRKSSLPAIDLTPDNFARLEFIPWDDNWDNNSKHIRGGGITAPAEIAAFLNAVKEQKSPEEAGLYEKIKDADGMLNNCYVCGYLYGYFADEPNFGH